MGINLAPPTAQIGQFKPCSYGLEQTCGLCSPVNICNNGYLSYISEHLISHSELFAKAVPPYRLCCYNNMTSKYGQSVLSTLYN